MLENIEKLRKDLDDNGFLVIQDILNQDEVNKYAKFCDALLSNNIDARKHRHDLGNHEKLKDGLSENICQVMWPSIYMDGGRENSLLHRRVVEISKALLGEDMVFDFDMIIAKEAGSPTETPWHQDESYWPDLKDKRALSFWFPMVDATDKNGCMWFVSGSHKTGLRKHRPVQEGKHVMMTDLSSEDIGNPAPVYAGGCTIHTGRTLHYTGGNSSVLPRQVYIINCRPADMVAEERKQNYDHGLAGLETIEKKTKN